MSEATIPAGMYKGRAIAGSEQYGVTSKGNDQIVIDVDVPSLGRSLSVFLNFSENAAQYSIDKLRACGWSGEDLTNLIGLDKNEVDVNVKYESYNGEQKMKVDIFSGGGRVKLESPMDDKQKRAFAARMKVYVKPAASGQPRAATPVNGAKPAVRSGGAYDPGPPDTTDDIPF